MSSPTTIWSQFTDQTTEAGVAFYHLSGGKQKNHIVETMGGGAAFFDYDNDGAIDLYAVNGATVETYQQKSGPGNVLYHNKGDGTFDDVSIKAGVGDAGWGMGCTVGDIDGDGYRDLFVTNYGPNILYRNQGGSGFANITTAGVAGSDFSASAAFLDFDNDGDLDLYVTTYLVYDVASPPSKVCSYGGATVYCGPQGLPRGGDVLYRNDGPEGFVDVTQPSGISWANHYYGLGVLPVDYDGDGDIDIFVANDKTPNEIFRNNGNSTFTEVGLLSGVAYNAQGVEEAGMGVAGGDYDGDGDMDLYVTHFFRESNTLYNNGGQGVFEDLTTQAGLEEPTLGRMGWGTAFLDYDNDSDLDLFVANGHVYPQIDLEHMGTSYGQRNQLFRNDGPSGLVDASLEAGLATPLGKVSRGAAFGDYDNDGDVDIYVVNLGDTATLLRNDARSRNWLTVRLYGSGSNRDAIGANIRLVAGGKEQWRTINGASSYLSFSDLRAHFGLDKQTIVERLEITWPGGVRQHIQAVPANKLIVVHQNGGSTIVDLGAGTYE